MSNEVKLIEERQEAFKKFMETALSEITDGVTNALKLSAMEINAEYAPHIDSDAWANYREELKYELAGRVFQEVTNTETGRWAQQVRAMLMKEYKDQLIPALNADLLAKIDELKEELKEAYARKY